MGRGRPSFLKDRVSTTVSLEREDLEFLHENDTDIAEEFRAWVKSKRNMHQTTLEKLKAERDEEKRLAKDHITKWKRLNKIIKEEEMKEEARKTEQLQIIELETERGQIFLSKFRKLIFQGAICELDFYNKVKRELKFENQEDAKEWLLDHYKIQRDGERKFTEDRIKTFLRWDKDVTKYW